MKTMQWSDAARAPRDVAAEVDATGEVRLVRRGGDDLIITSAQHHRLRAESLDTVATVIGHLARASPADLAALLTAALPWVGFLPAKDQSEFAREFARTMQACTDLQVWAPFHRMVHEWRHTAAVHAEPGMARRLSRALDADLGPVLNPLDEGEEAKDGSR